MKDRNEGKKRENKRHYSLVEVENDKEKIIEKAKEEVWEERGGTKKGRN